MIYHGGWLSLSSQSFVLLKLGSVHQITGYWGGVHGGCGQIFFDPNRLIYEEHQISLTLHMEIQRYGLLLKKKRSLFVA